MIEYSRNREEIIELFFGNYLSNRVLPKDVKFPKYFRTANHNGTEFNYQTAFSCANRDKE